MPKEPISEMTSNLHTHEGHLPEMHDWEIGKKYKMKVEGKMTSHNAMGEGKHTGSFEISKVEPDEGAEEDNKEDKELKGKDKMKAPSEHKEKKEQDKNETGEKVKKLEKKYENWKG